jgi:hypothetical protein
MAMTYVQIRGQASSRPERLASVNHDPTIIEPQKISGAVVHRGYDARLIGM